MKKGLAKYIFHSLIYVTRRDAYARSHLRHILMSAIKNITNLSCYDARLSLRAQFFTVQPASKRILWTDYALPSTSSMTRSNRPAHFAGNRQNSIVECLPGKPRLAPDPEERASLTVG